MHCPSASLHERVATIVHIEQHRETPDGRWFLACRGRSRARVVEAWVEEGSEGLYMARLAPISEAEQDAQPAGPAAAAAPARHWGTERPGELVEGGDGGGDAGPSPLAVAAPPWFPNLTPMLERAAERTEGGGDGEGGDGGVHGGPNELRRQLALLETMLRELGGVGARLTSHDDVANASFFYCAALHAVGVRDAPTHQRLLEARGTRERLRMCAALLVDKVGRRRRAIERRRRLLRESVRCVLAALLVVGVALLAVPVLGLVDVDLARARAEMMSVLWGPLYSVLQGD
jgi:hypothetical protein